MIKAASWRCRRAARKPALRMYMSQEEVKCSSLAGPRRQPPGPFPTLRGWWWWSAFPGSYPRTKLGPFGSGRSEDAPVRESRQS